MRKKTVQALIDACLTANLHLSGKSRSSKRSVTGKLSAALAMVEEDKTRQTSKTRRRITSKAQKAMDQLRSKEWSTATELEGATDTHRFGDAIYNLTQNGYTVTNRHNKRAKQREYKLVCGPGWLGWDQGEPLLPAGKRKKRRRTKTS